MGLDLHELLLTPQSDAYFITTKTIKANLTAYGGPAKGQYVDPIIQEENLRTGKVIFSWNMAAHVPLSDSFVPAPTHCGADPGPIPCQFDRRERRRLSSAHLRAEHLGIYDISHQTGQVLWQLGGKQNQFSLPSALITGPDNSAFQYQHDARFVPGGISLFDDAGIGALPTAGPTAPRGLIVNLDLQNHTASLADPAFYHDPALCEQSG